MLKFCVLGVCLPLVLLCVPLYMRFISLRPHLFHLSPLDMKLLNYEHKVSTIWCSKQTLRSVRERQTQAIYPDDELILGSSSF